MLAADDQNKNIATATVTTSDGQRQGRRNTALSRALFRSLSRFLFFARAHPLSHSLSYITRSLSLSSDRQILAVLTDLFIRGHDRIYHGRVRLLDVRCHRIVYRTISDSHCICPTQLLPSAPRLIRLRVWPAFQPPLCPMTYSGWSSPASRTEIRYRDQSRRPDNGHLCR